MDYYHRPDWWQKQPLSPNETIEQRFVSRTVPEGKQGYWFRNNHKRALGERQYWWDDRLREDVTVYYVSDPDKINWLKCMTAFHALLVSGEINGQSIYVWLAILLKCSYPLPTKGRSKMHNAQPEGKDHRHYPINYPSEYIDKLYSKKYDIFKAQMAPKVAERGPQNALVEYDNGRFHEWCCWNVDKAKSLFTLLAVEMCRGFALSDADLYNHMQFEAIKRWSQFPNITDHLPNCYPAFERVQVKKFHKLMLQDSHLRPRVLKHLLLNFLYPSNRPRHPQVSELYKYAVKSPFEYYDMDIVRLFDKVMLEYTACYGRLDHQTSPPTLIKTCCHFASDTNCETKLKQLRELVKESGLPEVKREFNNYFDAKMLIDLYAKLKALPHKSGLLTFELWKYSRNFGDQFFHNLSNRMNTHAISFAIGLLGEEEKGALDMGALQRTRAENERCYTKGQEMRSRLLNEGSPLRWIDAGVPSGSAAQGYPPAKRCKTRDILS